MFNVNGFLFEDKATAELAQKEAERILFFRERMDLNNPEVLFKLYKKILKDEYFVTPVGIRFLVELQNALLSYEQIPREEIPGIPVVAIALKTKENMPETDGYKKPFYVALFFAIVFAVSVAGMFLITEISGNNVNILNYRDEILNEYSTWEAQLEQKEAELAEWEEELEKREQR